MRPGKIVQPPLTQLAKISAKHNQAPSANSRHQGELARYIGMIKEHQLIGLQKALDQ